MYSHRSTQLRHISRGFTLLELLVAIAVFAIMSVMAYGGLSSVIDNNTRSSEALERMQQVQRTVFALGRDLSQIIERDIRDEYGTTQPYIVAGSNPDLLVEFTRSGRRNPAELLRSNLLRVAYRFEDNKLSRLFWPQLDRAPNAEAYETVLLDDVEDAGFRYLDENGAWHEQWPPLNASNQPGSSVAGMVAVEFRMELGDWGEIVRLFRTTI